MAQLQPISPWEYITKRDPLPESVLNVSAWYKTETLELTFGEYVGRPNEFVDLHKSDLIYYLGNGWYVDEVLSRGSDGRWFATAVASAQNNGNASSNSFAYSQANSESSEASGNNPARNYSEGNSSSEARSSTNGIGSSFSENSGGPFWAAWSKIRLKRRRMQSEAVLKDMIASFTKAYNEGREINNERYYELISLYAIMLSRTENEANNLSFTVEDFKPLADMIVKAVKDALEKFSGAVENIPKDWMQSRIDDINAKYDALVGEAKSKMVTNGTYNSTVWPTTLAGIEKQRAYALNNLKDEMVTVKIDAYGKIATITADIGKRLLDCEIAVIEAQNKMLLGPTEIRNTVFKWMLDFMERREDSYPGLDQIVTVADKLGYADGGMAAPTS